MKVAKCVVNGKYVKVNDLYIMSIGHFAYDGCHKIYVLESEDDVKMAMECGYFLYPIKKIKDTYEDSCPLKFIHNWGLDKTYVAQCEMAKWSEEKVGKNNK